jgi:sugar/nucleoside kinase (ribokinase family)
MSTDIFLPNSLEARRMTGLSDLEQAARALAKLCPLVVIKDGANGSLACSGENIIHISSIPVTPIDTTGAGDNFNAGFICAMLKGQPLENCLKWGNITGALSTTEIGGTTYEMTLDKLEKALNKYYLL